MLQNRVRQDQLLRINNNSILLAPGRKLWEVKEQGEELLNPKEGKLVHSGGTGINAASVNAAWQS